MAEPEKPTTTAESVTASQARVQAVPHHRLQPKPEREENYCPRSYGQFEHG